jgi:hypothetical protein
MWISLKSMAFIWNVFPRGKHAKHEDDFLALWLAEFFNNSFPLLLHIKTSNKDVNVYKYQLHYAITTIAFVPKGDSDNNISLPQLRNYQLPNKDITPWS